MVFVEILEKNWKIIFDTPKIYFHDSPYLKIRENITEKNVHIYLKNKKKNAKLSKIVKSKVSYFVFKNQ